MPKSEKCERCGRSLNGKKIVWLELSIDTGKYYRKIPKGHDSQGSFPFGSDCAVKELEKLKKVLYRPAKRKPRTRILEKQSLKLFRKSYMEHLEELGIAHRNTFYGKLKRRTLSNEVADKISAIFMVKTIDWYAGFKAKEIEIKFAKTTARAFRGKKKNIFLQDEIGQMDFGDLDELL